MKKEGAKTADGQKVPQKKSVAFLVFLSFITLGIYNAIWYIKRKPELDNLGTEKKLIKGLAISYLVFIVILVINQISNPFLNKTIDTILITNIFIGIIFFIFAILFLCLHFLLAFSTRTILNQALEKKGVARKVSWFFTLVFSLFYLQYEINRIVENRESEKRTGPWICLILLILIPLIFVGIMFLLVKSFMETLVSGLNLP